MKILKYIAVIAGVSFGASANAEVFDANISGDSVRIAVNGPLSRLLSNTKGEYEFGGIIGEDDLENDFASGHVGLMLTGDAGARDAQVTAGLGARLQYLDVESDNGGAVELGGKVEVRVPGYDRFGFSAYAWFGPEAASFGDVDDIFEYAAAIDYQILKDAAIYVGYRKIEADFGRQVDVEEDGVHGGIRLNF